MCAAPAAGGRTGSTGGGGVNVDVVVARAHYMICRNGQLEMAMAHGKDR